MVNKWGMTERLEDDEHDASQKEAGPERSPEREAKALIAKAEQAARSILTDNKERLVAVAEGLIERETLVRGEIARLAGLTSLVPEEDRSSFPPDDESLDGGLAPVRELPLR